MKRLFLVIKILFGLIVHQTVAQSSQSITLLTPTETVYLPAKVVLKSNLKDTLKLNLFTKFTATEPKYLVVTESFLDYKLFFKDLYKQVSYKQNDIAHLEFVDTCGNLRTFSFISDLRQKNIAEILVQGNINYYLVHSPNDFISNWQGYIFVEKEGQWIKHKKRINKKFFKKLQNFLIDQPDLAAKLNTKELSQSDFFDILRTYNARKH